MAVEGFGADGAGELCGAHEDLGWRGDPVLRRRGSVAAVSWRAEREAEFEVMVG